MRNTLSAEELDVFEDYLEVSENYFEFGSSETTLIASKYQNIQNIFTVTSEKNIYEEILQKLSVSNVKILFKDINAGNLGIPLDKSKRDEWPEYSKSIINHTDINWDLILINGRFRVACAAASYNKLTEDGYLLIHDFNRASYAPVLNLYTKIHMTKTLAVFKKKNIGSDLLNKYQFNYE